MLEDLLLGKEKQEVELGEDAMAYIDSSTPIPAKFQQSPQYPWSLTVLTYPCSTRLKLASVGCGVGTLESGAGTPLREGGTLYTRELLLEFSDAKPCSFVGRCYQLA